MLTQSVTIPEGTSEGYQIVFTGKGSNLPFTKPSSVIFTLHYLMPKPFQIRENVLYATVPVGMIGDFNLDRS